MKEIDLRARDLPREQPTNWSERLRPDMSRELIIEDIIKKVEAKENVYVKFTENHNKRPGAIALVKKIEGSPAKYNKYGDKKSWYTFHLKWDDRKNTTKVELNHQRNFVYLPDYEGPTVWYMFDPKAYAEEHAEPVLDRLGSELNVNDTVVYINSRYGFGADLDFGVIREIKRVGKIDWHNKKFVDEMVIIESISIDEIATPLKSKIKCSDRSIIKINDVDLSNEAFIRKLIQ